MPADLLQSLDRFEMDDGPAARPFAARLAREHGWPRPFADRVVTEYKRFAYLAATAGHPVTPSQAVDHCWHLHLCYTRSYWERFCPLLPAPLHHTPTAGGPAERARYRDQYERTRAAYRSAFGHEPPADIWPPPAVRFGHDLRERTVNTADCWVVPKATVKRLAAAAVGGLAVLTLAGCGGIPDPFGLTNREYFAVLIPALAIALGVGAALRMWATSGPDADPPTDWESVALLTGGPQRLLQAALVRLTQAGAAELDGGSLKPVGPPPAGAGPVERLVHDRLPLQQDNPVAVLQAAQAVGEAAADTRDRLDAAGLTLTAGASRSAGYLAAAPLAAVLVGLGLPRLVSGLSNGKPVGFLLLALFGGAVLAGVMVLTRPYRTRAGDRAVRTLRGRADAAADAVWAVAAVGTACLAGTAFVGLHTWYPRKADATGGFDGGDSGGDSGGGDGGGGCGGGCGGGD